MLRLEDVSYLSSKLNLFITVDGVKRLIMLGSLERVPVCEDKAKYRVSKYGYGVNKKYFEKFLRNKGVEEDDINHVLKEF